VFPIELLIRVNSIQIGLHDIDALGEAVFGSLFVALCLEQDAQVPVSGRNQLILLVPLVLSIQCM
jgi:hypothetical protein